MSAVPGPSRIAVGDDYEVLVGEGVLAQAADLVDPRATRALVVHPDGLEPLVKPVVEALQARGLRVVLAPVPDAESAKTVEVAAGLWSLLGRHGFTRTDVVVGVGGGSVTDLAGFVAATWLRGVPVVQVPTTLLAMVDAAVGGKTGINTPEGKNLVGAFHLPAGVVCDLDVLATLPAADLVAGSAEIVKGGFIADPRILELVEEHGRAAIEPGSAVLRELVERKIAVKARVVAADLKESSLREILNYGHTLGHAIEQHEGYRRRHGEAVAIGMTYAAYLSHQAGRLGADAVERHLRVLQTLGLPTTYDGADLSQLMTAMRRDKKTRGDQLRFVVLDDIARPGRLEGPSERVLDAAYARLSPGRSRTAGPSRPAGHDRS